MSKYLDHFYQTAEQQKLNATEIDVHKVIIK
jgi:hypothetical protein